MSCPLGNDQAPGILEGSRQQRKSLIRKGLLRPWTSHRASTPTTTTTAGIVTRLQGTWPPQNKSEAAPQSQDDHAPVFHPLLSQFTASGSCRRRADPCTFRGLSRGHHVVLVGAKALHKASRRVHLFAGRHPSVPPTARASSCTARSPQQHSARPQLHNTIPARPQLC